MTFYPGDPEPVIEPAPEALPWKVTRLSIGTHTGTHIDAAIHYDPSGRTIDQYPIERFILPGVVVNLSKLGEDEEISEEMLVPQLTPFPEGGAVLIHTAWDRTWKNDLYFRHPYLSAGAAQRLVAVGASLVGIDALNVDSTVQGTEYVHHILLGQDILIVENLTGLDALQPGQIYQFSFLPIRLPGLDGSPIRAVAWDSAPSGEHSVP
jgi:kynurenine formamidase